MNTVNYLGQIERLDRKIKNTLFEIDKLRSLVNSVSIKPKEVDVQTSGENDKIGNIVSQIVDLEKENEKSISDMVLKRKNIISQIDTLDDINQYDVIYKRFVLLKNWDDIALEMNCSKRTVQRFFNEGIVEFENLYGKMYL